MKTQSYPVTALILLLLVIIAGTIGYFFGISHQGPAYPAPTPTPTPNISREASPTPEPQGVACTMDAKLCPDGSAVGRVPPNCEFAPCPAAGSRKPSTDESCVDFMGNVQDPKACEGVPAEGRACKTTADCSATCSHGCLSRTWMSKTTLADCMAEPQYTCGCVNSVCVKSP